jgi:ABC-type multidrug transport system permease subunit
LLKAIGALIFGATISFIGVALHNAFHPVGIFLALLTTAVGIKFAGELFGARKFKIIAAIAWVAVALRAGSYGLSHEILIISNLYGNIFLLGGLLVASVTALKKI